MRLIYFPPGSKSNICVSSCYLLRDMIIASTNSALIYVSESNIPHMHTEELGSELPMTKGAGSCISRQLYFLKVGYKDKRCNLQCLVCTFFLTVLGMEPRLTHMQSKGSTAETHPFPDNSTLKTQLVNYYQG